MPWPGNHTLALRSGGGLATGTFARRGVFFVGGLNLENTSLFDQLSNGVFNGAFVLRGYPPGSSSGRAYLLQNIEYRIPLAEVDRGISTLPVYLRRIDANLFLDYGGAFNQLRYDRIKLFQNGALIDSPDMHTSVGAEIWLGATAGYVANFNMRLGYAFGLSAEHIPGGQGYFIASSAF
jgi:outer membrane protein assembly factor BamA